MPRQVILLLPMLAMLVGAPTAWGAPVEAPPAPAAEERASELLDRAFQNLYADDYIQTLVLATKVEGSRELKRRLQLTRKQSVRPSKTLLRFLYPQTIRRTSVLVLETDDASDDLYVYLPAVRITRHLSSAQKGDSFFGTDLSYEDVEPKYIDDYVVRFLGQDASTLPGEDGPDCLQVEILPAPHYRSAYERQVSCIDPERAIILWTDYFVSGRHLKRLVIDPEQVRAVGERLVPFLITVQTPRQRSVTRVVTENYELQSEIPDTLFNAWNLEAGDAKSDRKKTTPALDAKATADDLE